MAYIYCSNKMAKWLGTASPLPETPREENTWNANLFKIERKNWLICVHNPTAYILLFPEVKKAEMKDFALWFYPRLSEQFHYDQIAPELAALFPSEEMSFYVTNNHRRTIGIMNHHVRELKYLVPYWRGMGVSGLLEFNSRINAYPMGPSPYIRGVEEMRKYLDGGTN